jgi:hypothetical protein
MPGRRYNNLGIQLFHHGTRTRRGAYDWSKGPREGRKMRFNSFCSALMVVLALSGTAAAQDQRTPPKGLFEFKGTPEEQAACAPDSKKFCSDAIPDTFRVLACLQENRARLRKACQQVLQDHGQ